MRTLQLAALATLTALTVAGLALDAAASSRACISPVTAVNGTTSFALVTGTTGFVMTSSCPTGGNYHVDPTLPCPVAVGPQPGQYCGPTIPPFSKAVCTWFPVVNTVPTGLFAGYDYNGDGHVWFPSGERVQGPIPPFPAAGVVVNPTPLPGRLIAYPTNMASMAPAPGDLNLVFCA